MHAKMILRCAPLFFVLVVGALLRLWGIRYGLPYTFHPDESLTVNIALSMGYTMDPNPHWFIHPSLYFYVLSILYGTYYVGGFMLGAWNSSHDFAMSILRDPSIIYLLGRFFSALTSTATLLLTYITAKKLVNTRTGILTAILTAPLYLPVYFGHFIHVEALQTFLTLASFYFAVAILNGASLRYYLAAGLLAGLATATKYPSVLVALSYVAAHVLGQDSPGIKHFLDRRLFTSFAASIAGFALGSPYCLIELPQVIQSFCQIGFYALPRPGTEMHLLQGWIADLCREIGMGPLILFFLGSMYGLWKKSREYLILLVFPVSHFVLFSLPGWKNVHWQVVTLPFFAITGAYLLDVVIGEPKHNRNRLALGVAILAAVLIQPFWRSISYDILLTKADTRILAKEWIQKNIPAGSKIAMEKGRFSSGQAPPISETVESIERNYLNRESSIVRLGYRVEHRERYFQLLKKSTRGITYDITPILSDVFVGKLAFSLREPPWAIEEYLKRGIRYVITCGCEERWQELPRDPANPYVQACHNFLAGLHRYSRLLAEFLPRGNLGPAIRVYQIKSPLRREFEAEIGNTLKR